MWNDDRASPKLKVMKNIDKPLTGEQVFDLVIKTIREAKENRTYYQTGIGIEPEALRYKEEICAWLESKREEILGNKS